VIIDEELVSNVAKIANSKPVDETLKEELKQAFPGIRFTLCSEDDIHAGKPVLESEGFEIYLVGSSDACLTLTNDYALATGVVIAEIWPEEE
jgi:hypothetical protein